MAKKPPTQNELDQTREPDDRDVEQAVRTYAGENMAGDVPTATAPAIENDVTLPGYEERPMPDMDAQAALAGLGSNDVLERMTKALESIDARASSSDSNTNNDRMADAIAMLAQAIGLQTKMQMEGSKLVAEATKRAQRPNNERPPLISDFNPRGDKDFPRPKLVCEMFIPYPAEPESLTREEIELLNLVSDAVSPGGKTEAMIRRNDNTKIKLNLASITKLDSDQLSRFTMNHDTAFNNDNFRTALPLATVLRQVAEGSPRTRGKHVSILTMDEELALIAAKLLNNGQAPAEGQSLVSVGEM